jgi:hypothetical protein
VTVNATSGMSACEMVSRRGPVIEPVVSESLNNVTPPETTEKEAKPVAVGGLSPVTASMKLEGGTAAMVSEIPEDEVRNEAVPLTDSIAVALPDGEEADAVAVAMPNDVRMVDDPALGSKKNVSSNVPDDGTVKSSVAPSMSEPLTEPDADPVPVMAVVRSPLPASVNSTGAGLRRTGGGNLKVA